MNSKVLDQGISSALPMDLGPDFRFQNSAQKCGPAAHLGCEKCEFSAECPAATLLSFRLRLLLSIITTHHAVGHGDRPCVCAGLGQTPRVEEPDQADALSAGAAAGGRERRGAGEARSRTLLGTEELGARASSRRGAGRGGQGANAPAGAEGSGPGGGGDARAGRGGAGQAGAFPSRGAVPVPVPTPAPAPTPARLAHQKSRLAQTKPARLRRGRSQLSAAAMQQLTASPVSPSTAAAPAPPDTSVGSVSPGAAALRSCGASPARGCAGTAALAMARSGRRAAARPGGAGAGAGPGPGRAGRRRRARARGGARRCPRVTPLPPPRRCRGGSARRAGTGTGTEAPGAEAPGAGAPRLLPLEGAFPGFRGERDGRSGSLLGDSWATQLLSRFGKVKPYWKVLSVRLVLRLLLVYMCHGQALLEHVQRRATKLARGLEHPLRRQAEEAGAVQLG